MAACDCGHENECAGQNGSDREHVHGEVCGFEAEPSTASRPGCGLISAPGYH